MRDINSPQSNRPINRRNDFGYLSVAQPSRPATQVIKPAESNADVIKMATKKTSLTGKFSSWMRQHRVATRAALALMALLMLVGLIPGLMEAWRLRPAEYELNSEASTLAGRTVPAYGMKLSFDAEEEAYIYNKDYTAPPSGDTGMVSGPRFSAKFKTSGDKAYTITDVVNNVGITFTPQFDTALPTKDINRLIYPLRGIDGQKVVTLKAAQLKEDIILNSYHEDSMEFAYEIGLSDGLEARLEKNGDIGVYGVQPELLGSVSAGTEADQALLEKARKNSKKNNLIFTIPAPFIVETDKSVSKAKVEYRLEGKRLTVRAENLQAASYPLSIDPSIYIETADKLMRGNNETNVDFDIDNELIQKSQTTGARINAWQSTTGMNNNTWNHSTATAGGYIYRAGGRIDPSKPQIVGQQRTLAGSNTGTFTMDMPSTRPAGDLYIAMMCHDGSNGSGTGGSTSGNTISTPTGWTKYADLQGLAAYYKIGTDQGGGNESASYQWTGSSEEWAGVVIRVTGFNAADPVSGTAGTGFSTSDAVPVFPATTPDSDATLVVRAAGFDQDDPSNTGWVPSGHTKIDSESSSNGGNGSCGFVATSLDVPPASGVSTGTQALTNDGTINDDYGAATIAINPATVTAGPTDSVYWAEFNNSTKAIDSPNPGTGACSGWCTDTDYDLPTPLVGHSLVTYNGYLYAIGGRDSSCTAGNGTGVTGTCDTVYISKLGANGEPALWHPTDTNKNNWVYWYRAGDLTAERAYFGAVAYNNKMYVLGGANGSNTTSNAVYSADILPNGNLGTWTTTGMQTLPSARYGHSVQVYNDVIYLIGGNTAYTGTPVATTHYSKLNSNGTMNAWTATTSFANGRMSMGGIMTAIWGAYIYLAGGCTAVNGSGYCTTYEDDTQLASINADGSLAPWNEILGLTNQRIGYTFVAWQGGLYRLGGCTLQNTSTGNCTATLADVDYGVINPDGEASTVASTNASGAGTCTGGGVAYNCDLPSASVGNMLNASVVLNGYLYIMGGCTNNACTTYSNGVTYQAIGSDGRLQRPAACSGSFTDSYCVSSTTLPSARGAAATAVFNNRIYLIGGFPTITNISYTTVNADGSIGSWSNTDFTDIAVNGIDDDLSYAFAYTRANPTSASSIPGNLFIFGGCTGDTSGIGCSSYSDSVYKCDLSTTGVPSNCTITGQLQIGTVTGGSSAGLGAHAGAVYANYIYLMGGLAPGITDLTSVRYARFDDSNNVVAVSGSAWVEGTNEMNTGRRRGAGFGYNGYLYVLGGYDGADAIADIEFAKINVSDGSWGVFNTSTVSIQKRWGLTTVVSNSYAYVVGGCTAGAAPGSCSARTNTIQVFQIYNNDSGAPASYSTSTTRTQTSIADANVAGNQSSLAIGSDGLPVISYFDDTNDDLAVMKCGNAACTSGNTVTKISDPGGDSWGAETNIAIGNDGYPVIAHWNSTDTDLAITKCSNASCSSNTTTKFAEADATGRAPAVVIGTGGLPVVVYRNTTDTDLMISECTTESCTALNTIQDSSGNYGSYADIVLGSDGFPIISHRDSGNSDLAITKCSTANCSSRSTATVAFTSGGFDTSIAIGTDNFPIVTSMDNSSSEVLNIVKCGNTACSSGNTTTTIDPADNVGRWSSVVIGSDGLPVISYINFTGNNLVVTKCGVASCASGNTTTTFTGAGFNVGIEYTSIAVPADGLPVVSHFDVTSNNVAVLKCAESTCAQATGAGANVFTTDRIGAGSAILNGYLYVAGGCTGTEIQVVTAANLVECNTATSSVQYALLDAYGNIGTWNSTSALPAARSWGQLVAVGGSLYYLGGLANGGTVHAGSDYSIPNSDGTIPAAGAGSWSTLSGSLGDTSGQPGQARMHHAATVWNNRIYVVGGYNSSGQARNEIFISPSLPSGGDIAADSWTQSANEFDVDRADPSVVAYANNLYVLGGYDGTSYLNDVQFSKIDSTTGDLSAWTFSTSLPGPIAGGDAFAANGYMYLVGGRGSDFDCAPNTLVAPISANTTIATGNNPTGVGEWYETNNRYTGDRYGNSVTYSHGRIYAFGGGCQTAPTVSSITATQQNTNATSQNVTMPATVEAGDLLLVLLAVDGNTTITTPGGWTLIGSTAQDGGNNVTTGVYAKDAAGTEDGTNVNFAFGGGASEKAAAQTYRVLAAEWEGTLTNGVTVGTATGATTQNPNPPSLNPANWNVEQTLWLAYTAGSTYDSITSSPSGYGTNTHTETTTVDGAGASISSARLASATASQDPGTFTMNASQPSVTNTVAIRPAVATLTGNNRVTQSAVYSQPQLAKYSRLIDTDTDVFPTKWLMNGLDNSIGARWQLKYRSMHDLDTLVNPSEDCGDSATMATMTNYGQETNVGDVTLGTPGNYTPLNSSGANINCGRYFFFNVSIDASQTFGYPEDVDRGPTISDLSLFFTADPSKRLRHGKTFTGGEQQPLDTPFP